MKENFITEEEFFSKINEWIASDIENWNHITLLAFFCYKYNKKNNMNFKFLKNRKGPTLGKEASDFAKLFKQFAPDNYSDLSKEDKLLKRKEINLKIKNYISWMFDYKYRYEDKGKAITTQFFLAPYNINDFEIAYEKALKVHQAKYQINDLIGWCKKSIPDIFNEHQLESVEDIKLINKYAEMYKLSESSNERKLILQAKNMGILK